VLTGILREGARRLLAQPLSANWPVNDLLRKPPGVRPYLGLIDQYGQRVLSPPERVVDQVSHGLVSRDKLR
jgi:hypothetical protein